MIQISNNNSFEFKLEELGLGNLTVDDEIYKPWVLYNRERTILPEKDYYFFAYLRSLRQRTHKFGFSNLTTVAGPHQSGKSTSSCVLSWLIDETFKDNFEKRVIYDPADLKEHIRKADRCHSINQRDIGQAIVLDEAGNTVEAQNYYSEVSREFNKVLQMMGYLKPIIFFICPIRRGIDSKIRDMANFHYNIRRPNTREFTLISPRELKYDNITNRTWTKRPIIRYYGEKILLNNIKIYGIPSEILKRYKDLEKYKSEQIQKEYENTKASEEKKLDEIEIDRYVEKVIDNLPGFLNSRETGIYVDSLHYTFKIPIRACNVIKLNAERKLKQDGFVFPGKKRRSDEDE